MSTALLKKLFFFGFLYFVQGTALSYFQNFQKPYLASLGISSAHIGILTSLLLLPFLLKIAFGFLSDQIPLGRFGKRKPYMAIGLILSSSCFFLASQNLPDQGFYIFSAFMILASFGVAIFDAAADGLAVESTTEDQQSTVQSAMIGGKAAGFIVMSLVFGSVAQKHGYGPTLMLIAVACLLPFFLFRSIAPEPQKSGTEERLSKDDFKHLLNGAFAFFALYAVGYSMVNFGIDGLITYYLSSNFGIEKTQIGQYGSLRGVGGILGAIGAAIAFAATASSPSKRKYFKVAMTASLLLSLGALTAANLLNGSNFHIFAIGWGFAWGFQETVFVTIAMSFCRVKLAAATFASLMAIANFGTAIGEGFGTGFVDTLGFETVFFIFAILAWIALIFLRQSLNLSERNKSL